MNEQNLEKIQEPEQKDQGSPIERAWLGWFRSVSLFNRGLLKSYADINDLYGKTMDVYQGNRAGKMPNFETDPGVLARSFAGMTEMYMDAYFGALKSTIEYTGTQTVKFTEALMSGDPDKIAEYWEKQAELLDSVVNKTPEAFENIKGEYGLHFENEREYKKISETPRAMMYQVMPLDDVAEVDLNAKPVLFLSPFILTDGIQALLPHEGISLVHSFANKGVPTYIMHYKDILETPEVQTMKIEDAIDDTGILARQLTEAHGQEVTIVGTCQGGAVALAGGISGKWKGAVDSIIQNVPPNDLSQSPEWQKYLQMTPNARQELDNVAITLPNGNKVICGEAASLSMRLKNMKVNNPTTAFLNSTKNEKITKFGSAVQAWLKDIVPLPYYITRDFSQAGAMTPIGSDPRGKMPYQLYGQDVYLDQLMQNIKFIHAIGGEKDDVCTPDVVSAPFKHSALKDNPHATVTFVKGGHIVPMTSAVLKGKKDGGVYAEGGSYWAYEKFAKEIKSEEEREANMG